jgi:hypothetical protein
MKCEPKVSGLGKYKNFRLTLFQCRHCSLQNSPLRTSSTTQNASATTRSTAEPPVPWCCPAPPTIQLQSPWRRLIFVHSLDSNLWGNQDVSTGYIVEVDGWDTTTMFVSITNSRNRVNWRDITMQLTGMGEILFLIFVLTSFLKYLRISLIVHRVSNRWFETISPHFHQSDLTVK